MHNYNLNTSLLDEFDLNESLLDEFDLNTILIDEFDLNTDLAHLVTDAAGVTRLFQGGFFQSNGTFVATGSWDS